MKKTGLVVSNLITLVRRKGGGNTWFPYKNFICRCSNCLYSTKGKCALKECCCMDERIRAHTCTFGEMMRYCFRASEITCFNSVCVSPLNVKRNWKAASWMRDTVNGSMKVLFIQEKQVKTLLLRSSCFPLMRAYGSKKVLERNCVVYSALELTIKGIDVNPHNLFTPRWILNTVRHTQICLTSPIMKLWTLMCSEWSAMPLLSAHTVLMLLRSVRSRDQRNISKRGKEKE